MKQYTSYCSKEQTEKALKLGAPLIKCIENTFMQNRIWYTLNRTQLICVNNTKYYIPTTQQMISWIESQNIQFDITPYIEGYVIKIIVYYNYDSPYKVIDLDTKLDAIMAAIDSTLDYLEENKGKDPLFDSFREKLNNIKKAYE